MTRFDVNFYWYYVSDFTTLPYVMLKTSPSLVNVNLFIPKYFLSLKLHVELPTQYKNSNSVHFPSFVGSFFFVLVKDRLLPSTFRL